ncbi:MAG: rRNA maturation RNase YbeY [Longimicrobiales bacterium]
MSDDELDVSVNGADGAVAALLERAVRATLAAEGVDRAEVSLTLLADAEIQALNLEYLGKDRPTDVIAFDLADEGGPPLGDIYVGADQARRQAAELEVGLSEELVRLAVHGTLHVLGHDHPDGPERVDSPMYALQERMVAAVLAGGQPPVAG